ncbi:hypothetical protein JTE88_08610 [Arcanobacterium phocisimile]|uniref:Transposase n=1 Tax=Arcanobacterium phocisimile TaxID=1302235 RepID=A0ABX7IG84_9ACTO|nr:hypothetical protein [Arcanobacterium phocisimile]QRV02119.1 hypothetical protein JTE88_08610 [Arcanobacterium phocisimile]
MARKFTQGLKDWAIRLAFEHQQFHECPRWVAAQGIVVKLRMSPHSILDWMKVDPSITVGYLNP